jgi:hypothetical protein
MAAEQAQPTAGRSFIPIIITIVGFTVGAGILIARMGRKEVMADWANRRCEIPIMFAGALYKPESDPRTPGEFSSDNFSYCIKQLQKKSLGSVFAAPLKIFDKQLAAAKTVAESQNADKLGIANLLKGIVGQILGDFYKRMRIFGDQLSRVMQRFRMGYERLAGAVNSVALAGLAMMQAIFNAYNTVALVVIIILGIIAGVFILFFFALMPLLPMLISAVSILAAAGFAVGGLADVFCFAPDTSVKLADGGTRRIADLGLGDQLHGGGVVEGMYVMDGAEAQMYSISGVIVSGDHLVWNDASAAGKGSYCAVADHPLATPITDKYTRGYCPLISNRSLACCPSTGPEIWFRDWEEIEEESEGAWHAMVERMLNPDGVVCEPAAAVAASAGFVESVEVCTPTGKVPIRDVQIGDAVLIDCTGTATTRVLGVTEIVGEFDTTSGLGSATWIYDTAEKRWKHPAVAATAVTLKEGRLYNLITEAGTFAIACNSNNRCTITVRDAFEVGLEGIKQTYSFTMSELRKTDSRPPNR